MSVPRKRKYWLYQANKRYGKTVPGKRNYWLYQANGITDCTRQTNGTEKFVLGKWKSRLSRQTEILTVPGKQTETLTVPGKQKNLLYQANRKTDCTRQTEILYQANKREKTVPGERKYWLIRQTEIVTGKQTKKTVPGKRKYWLYQANKRKKLYQANRNTDLPGKRKNWLYQETNGKTDCTRPTEIVTIPG